MLPAWWIPYVQAFVDRVTSFWYTAPFTVTSFGRGRSHNRAVGGANHSQHLLWTAADLVPQGDLSMDELEAAAQSSGLFGYVLNEGDHVHVQLFEASQVPDWVYDQVALA